MIAGATSDLDLEPELGELLVRMRAADALQVPNARMLPAAERWLDEACALADDSSRDTAQALSAAAGYLRWYRPYDMSSAPAEHHAFLEGYACTLLCGPPRHGVRAPFFADDVLVAFALQAPGLYYDAHQHPARELYRVIGGTAAWWRNGEAWQPRPPGTWLAHDSMQAHAMSTGSEPMLAMAVWLEDLDGIATFSAATPPARESRAGRIID